MAYINHLYLVFKGGWRTTKMQNESWQFGVRYIPLLEAGDLESAGTPPQQFQAADLEQSEDVTDWSLSTNYLLEGGQNDINPKDYLRDQVGPAAKTFIEQSQTYISDEVLLQEITAYPIGADGKVMKNLLGPYKATATARVEVNGSQTGAILPPQTAYAVSLQTASTGRRGHGRFYMPPMTTSALNTAEPCMTTANRDVVMGHAKTFLENASLDDDPVTRPIVIGPPWSLYYAVTNVRCGLFLDTQKRRRKNVDEGYASTALSF